MEKVVTIVRTKDAPREAAYWKQQSTAWLATLEMIRQEYIQWKYDHQSGFQRVYRIVKHA